MRVRDEMIVFFQRKIFDAYLKRVAGIRAFKGLAGT
jgi:hypothetical protein